MSVRGNDQECEERGQAAAYVLRALGSEEAERYREHLHGCAVCSADVLDLQPIADSLPAAAPRMVAPLELHERVMATVRSEAELLHAAGPSADRAQPVRPRRRSRRLQFVSAAVALGIGVLVGAVVINPSSRAPATRVTSAQLSSVPAGARALLRQSGGHAELMVSGIPQPPRGKIYEIWLAGEGGVPRPTNALFGVTHGGNAAVDVPGSLAGVRRVMVTAEPLGGSSHPTSTPIIIATLRSS